MKILLKDSRRFEGKPLKKEYTRLNNFKTGIQYVIQFIKIHIVALKHIF